MMSDSAPTLLDLFESQALDPAEFKHRDHIETAYEMLRKHDFMEAAGRYSSGIQKLATGAGVPEKYNATITLAFLSLIAERMAGREHETFAAFIAENEDLLAFSVLERWYSKERMTGDTARRIFLMPDRAA